MFRPFIGRELVGLRRTLVGGVARLHQKKTGANPDFLVFLNGADRLDIDGNGGVGAGCVNLASGWDGVHCVPFVSVIGAVRLQPHGAVMQLGSRPC